MAKSFILNEFELIVQDMNIQISILFLIILFVFIDSACGIYKSLRAGISFNSDGLKRTVDKLIKYLNLVIIGIMIDYLFKVGVGFNIPYVTIIFAAWLLFTEAFSWFESVDQKERERLSKTIKITMALRSKSEDQINKIIDELEKDN